MNEAVDARFTMAYRLVLVSEELFLASLSATCFAWFIMACEACLIPKAYPFRFTARAESHSAAISRDLSWPLCLVITLKLVNFNAVNAWPQQCQPEA